MSQYLIPCDCGAKTPVNRSQAGMTLPCKQCGKSLEVPTIRHMSSLESTTKAVPRAKTKRPPVLLGLIAALSLICSVITLSYGAFIAWDLYQVTSEAKRQNINLNATEEDFFRDVREFRLSAPPADTWDYWNALVEEGLSAPDPPEFFKLKRFVEGQRPWANGFLLSGAISLVVFALCAFVMQWSRR